MAAIRIVKGYPISFLITVNQDGTPINVNDGTWDYTTSLHYQTFTGVTPFNLTTTPTGSQFRVDIANTQTTQLNHLGAGYVLVVNCSKHDGSAYIQNEIPVNVSNVL